MSWWIRWTLFAHVKFGDSLQETFVLIQQEFEERKASLQLLQMENCDITKKNFNLKLVQGNSDMIIGKVVTKYKSLHNVVSCKRLCFHIIEFLFKNEYKIINFCSLNRSNYKTNFEDLMGKNYQHVLNIGGLLVRAHEKWNAFIPTMFHRCPERNINWQA